MSPAANTLVDGGLVIVRMGADIALRIQRYPELLEYPRVDGMNEAQRQQHQLRREHRFAPRKLPPTGYRLPIQEGRNGKAKGYQVEQFLLQYEVENETGSL